MKKNTARGRSDKVEGGHDRHEACVAERLDLTPMTRREAMKHEVKGKHTV